MSATALAPEAPARRLIRLSAALQQLGISRASFYRLVETDPDFPKPIRHGDAGRTAPLMFFADEINGYLARLAESR